MSIRDKNRVKLIPPFNKEIAKAKIAAAAWNSKDSEKVSLAYAVDSRWRDGDQFFEGRPETVQFSTKKWEKEKYYKLKRHLWSYADNSISVRFEYEWQHSMTSQWCRAYGNEYWKLDKVGKMQR